jgi:hypothetical protein
VRQKQTGKQHVASVNASILMRSGDCAIAVCEVGGLDNRGDFSQPMHRCVISDRRSQCQQNDHISWRHRHASQNDNSALPSFEAEAIGAHRRHSKRSVSGGLINISKLVE